MEQERLELEERAREAKKPRHEALEMYAHLEDQEAPEVMALSSALQVTTKNVNARRVGSMKSYLYDEERHEIAVTELKEKMQKLKIVSRAKVTKERVYSAAYHPEQTKDLIFFGGEGLLYLIIPNSLVYIFLQTSMGHLVYGTHVLLLTKWTKTATRCPQMMLKVANPGGFNSIGHPRPAPPYPPSSLILSMPTA